MVDPDSGKFHYGTGSILMMSDGAPGKAKALWHAPAHGPAGQKPADGFYLASCGTRIGADGALLLRIPFPLGKMPRRVCKTCTY